MFPYHLGQGFEIRSLQHPAEMEVVYRLTHDNYVRRGIANANPHRKLIHQCPLSEHPQTTVFLAYLGESVVGTLSISLVNRVEELHNYDVFAGDLTGEAAAINHARVFSGWRLATSLSGPKGRIVSLQLLFHAMKFVMRQGIEYGYLCCRKEDLPFYERVCPGGKIIGYRHKKEGDVDTQLCMWRCQISQEDYDNTQSLVMRLGRRLCG